MSESEKVNGDFVTGGRNLNGQDTCLTCIHRTRSREHPGWGWCQLRENASVSPTGGCNSHASAVSGNPWM